MDFKGLVFDIGMHKGEDTIYYLKNNYRVIGVEANPIFAEECEKRFASYVASGQLIILNKGIADKETILPFYVNKRLSVWSSFDKSYGTKQNSEYEVINVACTTQAQIFEEYGIPYYLKVDIEGFDHLSLRDIPKNNKPKYVSFEASDTAWLDIVKEKGYTKFKLINQLSHKEMNPKLEASSIYLIYLQVIEKLKKKFGHIIPFKYKIGAAGPMSHELKGKWHSYDEIKAHYNTFFGGEKPLNNISWFDFHATY